MEKLLFFRGATVGLGKYHMGSYGRIGVYGVNCTCDLSLRIDNGDLEHMCTWLRVFFNILGIHLSIWT